MTELYTLRHTRVISYIELHSTGTNVYVYIND